MYVLINDIKIFFDVYGSKLDVRENVIIEKPTMILLHGGAGLCDHTLYTAFWGKFQKIAQVIFIDLRGSGRSDNGAKEKWNLKQWGKDVYDFCNIVGITKPIVAGVSFGGYAALSYATQFPDHIGKLILCNSEAKLDKKKRKERYTECGGENAGKTIDSFDNQEETPEIMNRFMKYCLPYFAMTPYKAHYFSRCIQKIKTWNHFKNNEMYSFDYLDELKNISSETLILSGKQDPQHPWEAAKCTADKIKNSKHIVFDNAGAPVYNDQPEKVFNIIKDFII